LENILSIGAQRTIQSYGRFLKRFLDLGDGPFRPSQIERIINGYAAIAIFDPRLVHFQVQGKALSAGVELTGWVSLQELKTGLIAILREEGISSIEDRVGVLPDPGLKGKHLALVRKPIVGLYREPTTRSEQTSQLLVGDAVSLLLRDKHYCLVQGPDGYIGWTPAAGLYHCEPEFFQKWVSLPRAAFLEAYEENGQCCIPLGAELPLAQRGAVLLPDNREQRVPEKAYRPLRWLKQPQRQTVVRMAKRFLGVPYLWGGKSMQGIDCSGLVQVAYRAAGIYVSRDANQQFLAGRLVATRHYRGELTPGDLIFFAGAVGSITHIGISLGESKYIHADGENGVVIASLDPRDAEYDAARAKSFVYAKRLIQ